ncbi:hypothetical protein BLSTO_01130 [Blastocystis sp. subtype 1]
MRGTVHSQSLSVVINPQSTIDIGSEEVEFPVCLSIIAEQTHRLRVGNLSVLTSVYEKGLVTSIYSSFLIITVFSRNRNEALMISIAPQIQGVLNNLALEIENSNY